MIPLNFIPVKFEGISIISLLLFSFIFALAPIYFWWDKREHKRISDASKIKDTEINNKVDLLFEKADSTNESINEIKLYLSSIQDAVEWIKNYMQKKI